MGEIADALRRAQAENGAPAPSPVLAPVAPVAPVEPTPLERPQTLAPAPLSAPGSSPAAGGEEDPKPEIQRRATLENADPTIALEFGAVLEASRQIALRLREALDARGAHSVAIASALRDEGKTTVLCNLAVSLASVTRGRSVALVDLDLRKPSVDRVLGLRAERGIERVLSGDATLEEIQISVDRPELDVYPVVEAQRQAHELLVLPAFAAMIEELERRYEIVLVDTPPTLLVPDVSLILRHVDACVPIARAGHTRARSFEQMIGTLPNRQIVGQLLNGGPVPGYSRNYSEYYAHAHDDVSDAAPRPR